MSFKAHSGAVITTSGTANIPQVTDLSGNGESLRALPSHVLIQAGAAAVTANWDGASNSMFVPATREGVFAVPVGARQINITGDATVSLGRAT